jgi:hypothetical protein
VAAVFAADVTQEDQVARIEREVIAAYDAVFELRFKVDDVMGKVEMLRDALGVIDIVERAAAVLCRALIGERAVKFREASLIPELHS